MWCVGIFGKIQQKNINEVSRIFKGFGRKLEDKHSSTFKGGESWEYGYDVIQRYIIEFVRILWGYILVILENLLYLV